MTDSFGAQVITEIEAHALGAALGAAPGAALYGRGGDS